VNDGLQDKCFCCTNAMRVNNSKRSFIQESEYWKHPSNGTVLKGFFYDHPFLNHAIVISEEQSAMVCSMWRWRVPPGCKWVVSDVTMVQSLWYRQGGVDHNGYKCFLKLIYFLPYLTFHTLHAKMSFFRSLCSFWVKISILRKCH
jgi:hypothetical protein